jgi:hemerythrin-like domain-containing protein
MASAGVLVAACAKDKHADSSEDVGATEDLMREHGVIRRILAVYRESATRLRAQPASVPRDALQQAATLMRTFGEDYHEKQLEEANIFPLLATGGGAIAALVKTLVAQHQRGREITQYALRATLKPFDAASAGLLASSLDGFARMYEEHAALEDTVVFPAWKKALTPKKLDEMGDRFEDIEKQTFGTDGFEAAVNRIATIERALGIDADSLTAPAPPGP